VAVFDALIVGGGPAGSTCARALHRAGWNVAVIDRAAFPRDKVCAGWITPDVVRLLDLDVPAYRAEGLTIQEITGFRVGTIGAPPVEVRYPHVASYGIRRCEFDRFLLARSGATIRDATPVASIRHGRDRWIVNETFEAPVLVGAGGHFCPVARVLRGPAPRQPVIAQEVELRLDGPTAVAPDTPELYFCRDLDGYAWCFRKGDYLNVGIGRRHAMRFEMHRRAFTAILERAGVIAPGARTRWRGHAYLAAGAGAWPLVAPGCLLIGDAAGLAYPESGEGIGPAVESGAAAAAALISADGRYDVDRLRPYEELMRRRHPEVRYTTPAGPVAAAIGRTLLRIPAFTRHAVLDRWFLRRRGDRPAEARPAPEPARISHRTG